MNKKHLALFSIAALAILGCLFVPQKVFGATLDLSNLSDSGFIGTVFFSRFASTGSGSGNLHPFLRLQGNKGLERGYNTDGVVEFETKDDPHTHSIKLANIPIVNGYYEIILDAAEPGEAGKSTLSLTAFQIWLMPTGNISGYPTNFSNLIYQFAAGDSINLDNLTSGNGSADMYAYIPVSLFQGQTNEYLYLYSEFGSFDGSFEEWAIKTAGVVPEPASLSLLGIGLLGLLGFRRKNN